MRDKRTEARARARARDWLSAAFMLAFAAGMALLFYFRPLGLRAPPLVAYGACLMAAGWGLSLTLRTVGSAVGSDLAMGAACAIGALLCADSLVVKPDLTLEERVACLVVGVVSALTAAQSFSTALRRR